MKTEAAKKFPQSYFFRISFAGLVNIESRFVTKKFRLQCLFREKL